MYLNNEEFVLVPNRKNWLRTTEKPAVTFTNSLILFNESAMKVLKAATRVKILISPNYIKFVPTEDTDLSGFSYRCEANKRRHVHPEYGEISMPSAFRRHGIATGTYICTVEENGLVANRNEKL